MLKKSGPPLAGFSAYLTSAGLDGVAFAMYMGAVRQFLRTYGETGLASISEATLTEHLAKLPNSRHGHFKTGWRHFRAYAEKSGRELPELPTKERVAADSYKYLYPVYWAHLLPLLKLAGMKPTELRSLTLGRVTLSNGMVRLTPYHPRGDHFAKTRFVAHAAAMIHLRPIYDWGHPDGLLDSDAPLIPDEPRSASPLPVHVMRAILNGSRVQEKKPSRKSAPVEDTSDEELAQLEREMLARLAVKAAAKLQLSSPGNEPPNGDTVVAGESNGDGDGV